MSSVGSLSADQITSNYEKYAEYFDNTNKSEMTVDTFINLLIAEISNQDPINPMSNTEFVSQMASFTSLQTMKNVEYYSTANYASSLIGKRLTVSSVTSGGSIASDEGLCTGLIPNGTDFFLVVNGKNYTLKNVMEVAPMVYNGGAVTDGDTDTDVDTDVDTDTDNSADTDNTVDDANDTGDTETNEDTEQE